MQSKDPAHPRNLSEFLLEARAVTPDDVESALSHQREQGGRFGEALVQTGGASEIDVCWALSRQLGMPLVDLLPETLDIDLIKSFPEHVLRRFQAVPLFRDDASLSIAFGDPTDLRAITRLEDMTGVAVIPSVATPSSVQAVLDRVWPNHTRVVERRPAPSGETSMPRTDAPAGAALLLEHLQRALSRGVSEIHFLPGGETAEVRYRVGGTLVQVGNEPRTAAGDLLERIKALGGPALDVGRFNATGRVVCPMGSREITLDVSLLGCEHGIAIRIGLHARVEASLEALGFGSLALAQLREVVTRSAGLVIVSGPPRSGRTTTLRALAAAVDQSARLVLGFEGRDRHSAGTLHIRLTPTRARERWAEIIAAHNADVVVLDDIFGGEYLAGALSSAAEGRLLFVSTDACNIETLFECLLRHSGSAALAADRLHAVIQQRMPRGADAGLGVDVSPKFEVLFVTDHLRELLRAGMPVIPLCEAARAEARRGDSPPSTPSQAASATAPPPPRA